MSIATIKVVEGVFSTEQKTGMIADVTAALGKYEGGSQYTIVTVEEVKSGDWGRAGVAFTAAEIAAAT